MRRKLVAGNWKMNGDSALVSAFSSAMASNIQALPEGIDVLIAAPTILLPRLRKELASTRVLVAAQNVSHYASGAYTGETSATMLREAGCDACLVGHSERRALFGDTDEVVLAKVRRLLEVEVQPIFCIGETLEQRDQGQATKVVTSQLALLLGNLSSEALGKIAIAYEPIWAIGTGRTASPEQAQGMHECIRDVVRQKDAELAEQMVLLYGGSVNADNSSELFAQPDIDGGLVGGASLQADNFAKICKSIACR